jgi:hypothetical protein
MKRLLLVLVFLSAIVISPTRSHAGDWKLAAGAGWAWSEETEGLSDQSAALPSLSLIRDLGGVLRIGAGVGYLPPARLYTISVTPAVYPPYTVLPSPREVEFAPVYLVLRLGPPAADRMVPFVQGGPMVLLSHWSHVSGSSNRALAGYHVGAGFAGPLAGRLGFEASMSRLESEETIVDGFHYDGLHRWVMGGALTWRL